MMQWWTDLRIVMLCHAATMLTSRCHCEMNTTPKNCSNNPAFQIAPPWRSPNQALIEKPDIEIRASKKGDCFHHLLLSLSVKVLHRHRNISRTSNRSRDLLGTPKYIMQIQKFACKGLSSPASAVGVGLSTSCQAERCCLYVMHT